MFGDVNTVTLLGNITNDVVVRYTPNGKAVTSFGLATNRRYKMPNSEEWKDEATFHNIVLWGNQAEFLAQKAHKGTRIFVTGYIQTRNWKDKEGKTNYKTEVVADKLILIDRYDKTGAPGAKSSGAQMDEPSGPTYTEPQKDSIIDPDDLPF